MTLSADTSESIELAAEPGGWARLTPRPGSRLDVRSLRAELSLLPEIPEQHAGSTAILAREQGSFWLYLGHPEHSIPEHIGAGGRLRASVALSLVDAPEDEAATIVVIDTTPDAVTEFELDD